MVNLDIIKLLGKNKVQHTLKASSTYETTVNPIPFTHLRLPKYVSHAIFDKESTDKKVRPKTLRNQADLLKSEQLNLIKIGPSGLPPYYIYYRQKGEKIKELKFI